MRKIIITLVTLICIFQDSKAQTRLDNYFTYTRKDTLRGMPSPLKTNYDLNFYHLNVFIDPVNKSIEGSNMFRFRVVENLQKLQFDLYPYLTVQKIAYHDNTLKFSREYNAVFVDFPVELKKGSIDSITVYYTSPKTDSIGKFEKIMSFTSTNDANGKPWLTTQCQHAGASTWWPSKEDLGDEVDSMMISITVPTGFMGISNGRLRKKTISKKGGDTRFDWFVSNPINNYCVAANVGDYVNIKDNYNGENGKLDIDYWVLRQNKEKAKTYFPAEVKPMLQAFEHWFGPYPFYNDSYKLIDANFVGMEHQSGVAYGNKYEHGYSRWKQPDISKTGHGLKFDYIIVHESGHEWFGNSISSKDVADWWIHESFTTYSEALYIDYLFGKKAGQEYVHGQRREIVNDLPIQGVYGVNRAGSSLDKYMKGTVVLNMIRSIINDDEKWRSILRGLGQKFYHQTIRYDDVVNYISQQSGIDFKPVFEQYFRKTSTPVLELMQDDGKILARWISEVPGFNMTVPVKIKGQDYVVIQPTTKWSVINLPAKSVDDLEVETFNYYIGVLKE